MLKHYLASIFFLVITSNGITGSAVLKPGDNNINSDSVFNERELKQDECPSYCDYCIGSECRYNYTYDYEDDIGLAVGWIIAIVVVGIILTVCLPLGICFCCGYCCFAACRKKQQPQPIYVQGPPPPGWQPNEQQK